MHRTLFGCLFACLLAGFLTACSGGSGDPAVTETAPDSNPIPTGTEVFVDTAAIAGPIVGVRVGEVVMLDDTKSYARSDEPMTYSWSFSHKPAGSQAVLEGANTANPSFVADVRGIYMLQLGSAPEALPVNARLRLSWPPFHPNVSPVRLIMRACRHSACFVMTA